MNNEKIMKISRVILFIAIIACIVIFLLPNNQTSDSAAKSPNPPKSPKKFIQTFKGSVPSSSENTQLNEIKMLTNYNNFIDSSIKTPILMGEYENKIYNPTNLVITEISPRKYQFSTKYNDKQYYLTYSQNENNKQQLEKGQLYWVENKNKQITLTKDDKNILFLNDLQLYFKWMGNDPNNRTTDFGIFVLRKGTPVNENIVTYIFTEKI